MQKHEGLKLFKLKPFLLYRQIWQSAVPKQCCIVKDSESRHNRIYYPLLIALTDDLVSYRLDNGEDLLQVFHF